MCLFTLKSSRVISFYTNKFLSNTQKKFPDFCSIFIKTVDDSECDDRDELF